MGTENTKGKTQKEDNMERVGKSINDVESGRSKSKVRKKRERDNKYQHPRPGSIFLHPVVCVCCIRSPVRIQTLQTSSHLPSWLQSNTALRSQDGAQSRTFKGITLKTRSQIRQDLQHVKTHRLTIGQFSVLAYVVGGQ